MQTDSSTTQKWLDGQISLGAAANWETDEIRIISEVAYSLAQQGRLREAIVLFEGLLAIAPATAYFHSALGALHLRAKSFAKAIDCAAAALDIEPNNITSLVNRGEACLRAGDAATARADLETAVRLSDRKSAAQVDVNDEAALSVKRARALLETVAAQK